MTNRGPAVTLQVSQADEVSEPYRLDGQRRRIRRGGYPSRKAALEVLGRLRNPETGQMAVVTVGTGSRTGWSPASPQPPPPSAATPRTSDLYLAPYLGEVLLTELTVGQVQAMFTAIIRQHQALGTPVSAATSTRIRDTLRAALNAAIAAACRKPSGRRGS